MRKILLIAYHFHPDASVGAQRTIKFAKYLPQFGWEPHVLTVQPKYYRIVEQAPPDFNCTVYRTNKWMRPDDLYKKARSLIGSDASSTGTASKHVRSSDTTALKALGRISWWKRFFNSLSITPDVNCGWFAPAVWRAIKLIQQHRYDLIYTSGPPQTAYPPAGGGAIGLEFPGGGCGLRKSRLLGRFEGGRIRLTRGRP